MSESPTLGVFPGDDYSLAAIRAVDEWLDDALDVVVTFVPAGVSGAHRQAFVQETLTPVWRAGYTPLVTWEPFVLEDAVPDTPVAVPDTPVAAPGTPVAALRDANVLREWAEALATWVSNPGGDTRDLIFRPAHEMNGWWYPWSAGAGITGSTYIDLWNALVDVFDDYGPPEDAVTWLWSANAESADGVSLVDYYPGDDVVDWVGVDGYNWGASRPWSDWQSPESVFEDAFDQVRSMADRPLVVPEVGCSSITTGGPAPERKSAWIADAFDLFTEWDVAAVGWFDANKETDWAVCTRSDTTTAPSTERLRGTRHGIYPAFGRAATAYVDGKKKTDG